MNEESNIIDFFKFEDTMQKKKNYEFPGISTPQWYHKQKEE